MKVTETNGDPNLLPCAAQNDIEFHGIGRVLPHKNVVAMKEALWMGCVALRKLNTSPGSL